MTNLKKLLLVGLLAISLAPMALAGTTKCPPADQLKEGQRQYDYTYNDQLAERDPSLKECPPQTTEDFLAALQRIFSGGAAIIVLASGLFILYAAFLYISSHGDDEKVSKAKDTIVYAVMGLVVAGLAYGLPFFIRNILF